MGLLKRKSKTKVLPRTTGASGSGTVQNDLNAGYVKVSEQKLRQTGLRGSELIAVVVCIIVLWLLALTTLICNILLLVVLRMNHVGMDSLQFHNLGNDEHLLQFTGKETYLDTIVLNSGVIRSANNTYFDINAENVTFTNTEHSKKPMSMALQEDRIEFRGATNFLISDPKTKDVNFNANKPIFKFQNNIKTIAASVIRTNRVRAPVDQPLKIDVENLIFRGNEGNYFIGQNVFVKSKSRISLRTSDAGWMNFTSNKGIRLGNSFRDFRLSTSPLMSARVMGRRLCVCISTGKMFAVNGTEKCTINPAYCY